MNRIKLALVMLVTLTHSSLLFAHPGLILAPRLAARHARAILDDPVRPPLRPPRLNA